MGEMISLVDLKDPTRYRAIPNVPVFKKHERITDNGKIVVTDDDLPGIVEASENLGIKHGVFARITIGHVDPKAKEVDQPPVVGFATGFKVGSIQDGKAATCTLYIRVQDFARLKNYPYRSVEYYPTTKEIRGVALLTRDSFLNLGTMSPLAYAMDDNMAVHYGENEVDEIPAELPEAAPTEGLSPEDQAKADAYLAYYEGAKPYFAYARTCYEASQQAAAAATPSASNDFIPDGTKKEDDMERMQADQLAIKLAAYESKIAALEKANAQIQYDKQTADCERMVVQLEAQGVKLDRAREVKALIPMTAAERNEHLNYVAAHYQRTPVNQDPLITYGGAVEGGAKKRTRADATRQDVDKALKLVESNPTPISYEAALSQVMGLTS